VWRLYQFGYARSNGQSIIRSVQGDMTCSGVHSRLRTPPSPSPRRPVVFPGQPRTTGHGKLRNLSFGFERLQECRSWTVAFRDEMGSCCGRMLAAWVAEDSEEGE